MMLGNEEEIEVKIEDEVDPLHLPYQIKVEPPEIGEDTPYFDTPVIEPIPADFLNMKCEDISLTDCEDIIENSLEQSSDSNTNIVDMNKWLFEEELTVPVEKIYPNCTGRCSKIQSFHCNTFSESEIIQLYDQFWSLSESERKDFVLENSNCTPTKRRRSRKKEGPVITSRNCERKYYLPKGNNKLRVCLQFFSKTIGINIRKLGRWTASKGTKFPKTYYVPKISLKDSKNQLESFVLSLPFVSSHYCGADTSTTRKFVEPPLRSVRHMFSAYEEHTKSQNLKPLSWPTFRRVLRKHNISAYKSHKLQCELCASYKTNKISYEAYETHIRNIENLRRHIKLAKQNLDEDTLIITVNFQPVLPSPCLQSSAFYQNTKLYVHNYIIYDIISKHTNCYIWSEAEGSLEASIFASILIHYLTESIQKNPNINKIKITTDDSYQNKSKEISNALLYFSIKNNCTIEHYYREYGHMDTATISVHENITTRLRKASIFEPFDYVKELVKVRPSKPYEVTYLDHTFFKNYKNINYYSSIKPDINYLIYLPDRNIKFKINYNDEWNDMPGKIETNESFEASNLYETTIKISAEKYEALQELKSCLPNKYHQFYDDLAHE